MARIIITRKKGGTVPHHATFCLGTVARVARWSVCVYDMIDHVQPRQKTPRQLTLKQGILTVMSLTATSDASPTAVKAEAAEQNASGPSYNTPTKIDDEFFKSTSLDDVDLSTTSPKHVKTLQN